MKFLFAILLFSSTALGASGSVDLGPSILPPSGSPSGSAGGDLGGTYPNPSVLSAAGNFTAKAELISNQSGSTTATVKAAAGTGASCALSHATDVAGLVTLTTTATSPSSGAECDINFSAAYAVAPICIFAPASANAIVDAVIQGAYFTTTTAKAVVNFNTTDATGRAYVWSYHCIETQ